jgi:hypothetical protein
MRRQLASVNNKSMYLIVLAFSLIIVFSTQMMNTTTKVQGEPYCDEMQPGETGSCWDRKDYDENTGLYPCKDGSQKEDWRDCD